MKVRARHLLTCLAALAALMALPVAASASKPTTKAQTKAAFKALLNSYDSELEVADAHLVTAVEQYPQSKDAALVETPLMEEIAILRRMRTAVKAQSAAGHPLIRLGKIDVLAGLGKVVVSCEHLDKAYADAATRPAAAHLQYERYRVALKRGLKLIHRGVRLV